MRAAVGANAARPSRARCASRSTPNLALPAAKAERLSRAVDCVTLSRAKGCEIGDERVAGVLTAAQTRVMECGRIFEE